MRGSLRATGALWLALPGTAAAQSVTVQSTGNAYSTLGEAVANAAAGDTLEVDGVVTGPSADVDRDVTVVGLPGAVLRSSDAEILLVRANVDLTVEGLTLEGLGATRAIRATEGNSAVVVRDSVIDARIGAGTGNFGGAVYLEEATGTFERVTFVGIPGQPQSQYGGAIYAYALAPLPLDLTDVVFDHVEATANGGAVWTTSMAVTCLRCTFDHTDGSFGGGVYAAFGSLDIQQGLFCAPHAGLGAAVFASSDTDIRATVFQEGTATANGGALYANGGAWVVENDHFVGNAGSDAVYANGLTDSISVVNNLFLSNLTTALALNANSGPSTGYNWFHGNTTDASGGLSATDITGAGDPGLVAWTRDGNCANDTLYPTPITSPLLDVGDPAIADPDGSRSDIGAFGGASADPDLHTDHDGDGPPFLHDCDDDDGANFPGNDERCDAADNDCDTLVDEEPIDIDEFFEDCDLDGQGVPGTGVVQCFAPPAPACGGGWASSNDLGSDAWGDCDDSDPTIYLGAFEYCDVVDHDCDGDASEGAVDATTYFEDLDGDGFGTTSFEECSDTVPDGAALVGGDCQDQDADVFPAPTTPAATGSTPTATAPTAPTPPSASGSSTATATATATPTAPRCSTAATAQAPTSSPTPPTATTRPPRSTRAPPRPATGSTTTATAGSTTWARTRPGTSTSTATGAARRAPPPTRPARRAPTGSGSAATATTTTRCGPTTARWATSWWSR
ncbi:MAG: MopE-related protein [Myxococcota bacterium]